MISDLILATERLKTEKKYLNKMVTKLVEENQKFLGENRHFREKMASFQSSPVPRKRVVEEIDEVKSTFTKVKELQDLEWQKVEEISEFHECKIHKNGEFLSTERINHLKMYLQQWEREMEDKKEDIIKEKHQISETRGTVAEQGKIIENLQTQINHLREELKNSELIACQPMEQKEVHSESPMHKVAKANLETSGAQFQTFTVLDLPPSIVYILYIFLSYYLDMPVTAVYLPQALYQLPSAALTLEYLKGSELDYYSAVFLCLLLEQSKRKS
ncbi:uncharacterized protein LOC120398574 isoform X1 [Mauremys reevesii]|uniref:uncharacterized protein LOC120398574 isoform X1 n=1 Tax=Mauremys reevesii TaxID=260615 RepID=UPI00193FA6F7|nr:uncharacterized protein LOC120398574 isoform X1 [Mauremys reevesii]XP_039382006.1 uncharacterized protein LOC120398574 isoform X1 [Mauremys reevesii]XP_039382007.1 uncharacterized protein LOC120398574 isoform X1 [Mauremys reevesii]